MALQHPHQTLDYQHMNLYKISQVIVDGYDTYSDAVVAAESAELATRVHPSDFIDAWDPNRSNEDWEDCSTWAPHPKHVRAEYLGTADGSLSANEVICASFHAG